MNVWIIQAYDQPKGMSSRCYHMASGLVAKGHKVTFFCNSFNHWTQLDHLNSHPKSSKQIIEGIDVIWLKTPPWKGNGFSRGYNMLVNAYEAIKFSFKINEKPDIVIGPTVPLGTGFAAYLISKIKKASFVFEIRDVWPKALIDIGAINKFSPIYWAFRFLEIFLYKKADLISSVLPFVHEHIAMSGSDPNKVFYIPNRCEIDENTRRPSFNKISEDVFKVTYIGGFSDSHDPITIVKAAELLSKEDKLDIKFRFIGDGTRREECENLIKILKVKTIEVIDPVDKSIIQDELLSSDLLIATIMDSPIYEFGINMNKIYDYLASGRPIIFSGKSENDPIKDSGCGVSILPEDPLEMSKAIKEIYNMPLDERKLMGLKGFDYAKIHFSKEAFDNKVIEMLKQSIIK